MDMNTVAKINVPVCSRSTDSNELNTLQNVKSNSPLRILMVLDSFFPGTGGAELQVELLARALYNLGHDVSIMVPLLDPSRPRNEYFDRIPVERIPYPRIKVIGTLALAARFAWRLIRARNRFDAIHVHTVKNLATVVGMLKPFLRASLMAKISGAWEFEGGVLDPALQGRLTHKLMNYFVKRYDYFQTISIYTKRRLEAAGYSSSKIQMIPNAVDMSRFHIEKQSNAPQRSGVIVAFGGRMAPVKGLDILVEAWAKVVSLCDESHPRLLLAGDGPVKAQLMQLVASHRLDMFVSFLDWVPEISAVLNQADIYVQPSLQEGLPNSVLEAMATSLPIVATRVSGNEDLVIEGENGMLVEAGCAEQLAAALCALISNPDLRKAMGRRSRQIIETNYQLPKVLEKLSMAYRREL